MTVQSGEVSLPVSGIGQSQLVVDSSFDLQIDIIDASQLCGDIADRWDILRKNNNKLAHPYFDIEFTKAVARVRDDVEIGLLRNANDEIVGLIPYQRVSESHAEPIGGRLNDVHGVIGIGMPDQVEPITRLMKEANLTSFAFHALAKTDQKMDKFVFRDLDAHFIDLREGWAAYKKWYRKHSKTVKRQGQKTRAMEREIGPMRFEFDCSDANVLEKLIELKRAKYQRSRTFDILSVEWAANLLREISTVDRPGFKGLLSVMYAGDELVAVHFGMLSDDVLHYWFPVFDTAYSRYSPGTELILQVAQEAERRGVTKVDLGYGDDAYKFKFCNGVESVSCGRVCFSSLGFKLAKRRYEIRQKLKDMPLKPYAKSVLRKVFPGFGQWNFK